MKHLDLVALQSQREELLEKLQTLGCVQLIPQDLPPDLAAPPSEQALQQSQGEAQQVSTALRLLRSQRGEKRGLLSPRTRLRTQDLRSPQLRTQAQKRVKALLQASATATALEQELAQLQAKLALLEPWLGLDVPLETTSTPGLTARFFSLPVQVDGQALLARLGETGELCLLMPGGQDRERQYLFLLCPTAVAHGVLSALEGEGGVELSFPGLRGTAAENEARLSARIREVKGDLAAQRRLSAGEPGDIGLLEQYLDALQQDILRFEAAGQLAQLGETFLLSGWFPAPKERTIQALLESTLCAWSIRDPEPEQYPEVPIRLENNPLTRPMNVITEMYALPVYDGVDPNPWMAPFFILFFGFMMADMAYGLLMIFGTLFLIHRLRPDAARRNFLLLFCYCGVSTLFWGALTGSFFGDFIPRLAQLIDPDTTLTALPALFTPLDDTIAIMVGSMALGTVQIFTGMAISVGEKCRKGLFLDALFDEVTWWIILTGGALALLGVGSWRGIPLVLVTGLLMLALGGTRKARGFGKLTTLVGLIYNGVTGFFSDILSYLRLMALMMAGSIISQVFNTLGSVFGSVLGFLVVSLIGNGLNFALNLLGCYVHALRLQCLEFFGRFYRSGGRAFRPLTHITNYTELIKEEA